MARLLKLNAIDDVDQQKTLARSFQSGHLNFLVGSGASAPAIPAAGTIEQAINELIAAGKPADAARRSYDFIKTVQIPSNKLLKSEPDANNDAVLKEYAHFLGLLEGLLAERKTSLLPKQATIFTTNYDLFFEKAAIQQPALRVNDGFSRVPSLDGRMTYSPKTFFDVTYNSGNTYSYKVEIPSINLIKLHGSLSWKKSDTDLIFKPEVADILPSSSKIEVIQAALANYAVILPQLSKFRMTLMDRTYYELLRIYANELDRENSLLVVFGFSFGDEHILDITRRALQNPTLRVLAFAHDEGAATGLVEKFAQHSNVLVFTPPAGEKCGFERFNSVIAEILPRSLGGKAK